MSWSKQNSKEFEKIYKMFDGVKKDMPKFTRSFLLKQGRKSMQKTMARTPVITGRLKRSWRLSEATKEGKYTMLYLTNDAKDNGQVESYASFVEYGTRLSQGRFMATKSLKEVESDMPEEFREDLAKWLKEKGL